MLACAPALQLKTSTTMDLGISFFLFLHITYGLKKRGLLVDQN